MRTVQVAAAIIQKDNRIFTTQRGHGEYRGYWEFPGGKLEPGESPLEALVREIREELDTEVEVGELADIVEYDYPDFHLKLYCFFCRVKSGSLTLKEHEAAKWLAREELATVKWLPADRDLIEKLSRS